MRMPKLLASVGGCQIEITCRIANNRWEHEFDWPVTENGQTRTVRTREIWHRLE
jgi:hypothetical protein